MIVTALLVKYAGGLHWVTDAAGIAAYGRREGYLELPARSIAEVERICAALFAERAAPQVQTTAAVEPTGAGDDPYVDFGVGDWVNVPDEDGTPESVRVRGLGIVEDDEGNISFPLVVRSAVEEYQDRVTRWLKSMSNGTLGGTVASAGTSGGSTGGTVSTGEIASPPPYLTFTLGGDTTPVAVRASGPYELRAGGSLGVWIFKLATAGTSTTTAIVKVNGVTVGTVNLTTGIDRATVDLSAITGVTGDDVVVAVTAAGTGAKGFVGLAPII